MPTAAPFVRAYRVRFDEAGADGHLRASGFLRYAQDVAWLHSEAEGYDRAWYAARQSQWLVRSAHLRLLAPVGYGATLDVSTAVTGGRRVLARRLTRFHDAQGRLCAEAETDWALLGPTGRPMRVPEELVLRFAPSGTFSPTRLVVGGIARPGAAVTTMRVRDADVDPMGHLNNAAYLDLSEEAASAAGLVASWAADGAVGDCRLEYLRPAIARSGLTVIAWSQADGRVACRIESEGVESCRILVGHGGAVPQPG